MDGRSRPSTGACPRRRGRYVGLCYDPPGVGKTLSARHYANWDVVEPLLSSLRVAMRTPIPPTVGDCHALVYTPAVAATPTRLASDLRGLAFGFNRLVEDARGPDDARPGWPDATAVDLLIVDEADRLKVAGLEQVRDVYDRANFSFGVGLVLIGLPGIKKRLARYPQLYSRVGFVHRYRPLGEEELRFVLTHKWAELGLAFTRRLHRRRSHGGDRPDHRRQLPVGAAAVRPDRTDPAHQRAADDHPGGRRRRAGAARDRPPALIQRWP